MPAILIYLLKLSVSLSIVYLFYHSVLRRLTFYVWNRFYLICYTSLSFFIPFIDITPVLERNQMMNSTIVQFIPNVGALNEKAGMPLYSTSAIPASWPAWDIVMLVLAAGVVIMLLRLLAQLVSFKKIIRNAQLVSDKDVKFYQVNQSIIPFSFGNSIFINRKLHGEHELQEIIRHEFVHVRQKHTLDIIWTELLCVVNWYNPFVWLIRKAIRQNLEFIADHKVLQAGLDKKQYQYLLLKVTGNNHFSIASQFNFSSLKKRIAMMNKMKSEKMHLLKFLFILPVAVVMLLAFRSQTSLNKNSAAYTGLNKKPGYSKLERPVPNVEIAKINFDTIPAKASVNGSEYILDVKNEKGKDIVVIKDKYQNTIKEVLLSKWNANRNYYENRYGKGVDEIIEHAVKQSMGLEERADADQVNIEGHLSFEGQIKSGQEMQLRTDMFNHKDVDSMIINADTILWSAKEKKLSFKGSALLYDKQSQVNASASCILIGNSPSYVLLDGRELPLDRDYVSNTKVSYLIISLGKEQSIEKYGAKGKNGALEIISQN